MIYAQVVCTSNMLDLRINLYFCRYLNKFVLLVLRPELWPPRFSEIRDLLNRKPRTVPSNVREQAFVPILKVSLIIADLVPGLDSV